MDPQIIGTPGYLITRTPIRGRPPSFGTPPINMNIQASLSNTRVELGLSLRSNPRCRFQISTALKMTNNSGSIFSTEAN